MLTQAVFLLGGEVAGPCGAQRRTSEVLRKVGGVPFIRRLLDEVARFGISDMVLLARGEAGALEPFLADNFDRPYRIRAVVVPEQAGDGASLRCADDRLDRRFFLFSGHSFFDINLLDLALAAKSFPVTLALERLADTGRRGSFTNVGGRIMRFRPPTECSGPGLVDAGIRVIERSILAEIDHLGTSLERNIFPTLIASGRMAGKAYRSRSWDVDAPGDLASHLRRPALFLDRDGVINVDIGYPHRPDQILWVEGALDAIRLANDRGYLVNVITNQAGIARGYYSEETVQSLHAWMQQRFVEAGAHVDRFFYCPHHPQASVAAYRAVCECRKPAPGMLLLALAGDVRREASLLVGDKASDIEAARRAGITGFLFHGGDLREFVDPLLRDWSTEEPSQQKAAGLRATAASVENDGSRRQGEV